jgi:membrane associated rhomboid family serine protease
MSLAATNPGTLTILALTVALSLAGLYGVSAILRKGILRPYQTWRGQNFVAPWLSGFIHADMGHLFFNMLSFGFFAFQLERRLGTQAFVIGYLLALVASGLPSLIQHRNDRDYATLGASGGVSAVIFAYIVLYPTRSLYILPLPVPIPAALYAVGYMAYSMYAGHRGGDRINHAAHIAGALCGLLWIAICLPDAYPALLARWR